MVAVALCVLTGSCSTSAVPGHFGQLMMMMMMIMPFWCCVYGKFCGVYRQMRHVGLEHVQVADLPSNKVGEPCRQIRCELLSNCPIVERC